VHLAPDGQPQSTVHNTRQNQLSLELKGELDQTRATRFGMLINRFGTPWINYGEAVFEFLNSNAHGLAVRARILILLDCLAQFNNDGGRRI
jgi:hypothetical protein